MNDDIIEDYCLLEQSVESKRLKLDELRAEFAMQSKYTRTSHDELGWFTYGFKLEDEVCRLVDRIHKREQRIQQLEIKEWYFARYLYNLHENERQYLYKRFVDGADVAINEPLETRTLDEISEIEQAVAYRFDDYVVDDDIKAQQFTGSFDDDFQTAMELLEVD